MSEERPGSLAGLKSSRTKSFVVMLPSALKQRRGGGCMWGVFVGMCVVGVGGCVVRGGCVGVCVGGWVCAEGVDKSQDSWPLSPSNPLD